MAGTNRNEHSTGALNGYGNGTPTVALSGIGAYEMRFPGDHTPTTEQRCTAAEYLETVGMVEGDRPLNPDQIDMLTDYLAELCRKDEVALAQKTFLRYSRNDLTAWYRMLALLHT
jgi:hypothetical protein